MVCATLRKAVRGDGKWPPRGVHFSKMASHVIMSSRENSNEPCELLDSWIVKEISDG